MAATLTVDTGVDDTSKFLVFFATYQYGRGRAFPDRGAFKQILATSGDDGGHYDLLAAYNAKFGALIANRRLFIRIKVVSPKGVAAPVRSFSVNVT